MSTEINLAIRRKKSSTLLSTKKVKKLRLFALFFLFAVGGLSAILFLIIASSPLPSLRQQEEEAASLLTAQQAKFGKYLLIKSQLASMKLLLESRPDLLTAVDTFNSLIPPGVNVAAVSITEKTLAFGVTSSSLTSIEQLFTAIDEKVSKDLLPHTIVTSPIAFNQSSGEYSFTLDFH